MAGMMLVCVDYCDRLFHEILLENRRIAKKRRRCRGSILIEFGSEAMPISWFLYVVAWLRKVPMLTICPILPRIFVRTNRDNGS